MAFAQRFFGGRQEPVLLYFAPQTRLAPTFLPRHEACPISAQTAHPVPSAKSRPIPEPGQKRKSDSANDRRGIRPSPSLFQRTRRQAAIEGSPSTSSPARCGGQAPVAPARPSAVPRPAPSSASRAIARSDSSPQRLARSQPGARGFRLRAYSDDRVAPANDRAQQPLRPSFSGDSEGRRSSTGRSLPQLRPPPDSAFSAAWAAAGVLRRPLPAEFARQSQLAGVPARRGRGQQKDRDWPPQRAPETRRAPHGREDSAGGPMHSDLSPAQWSEFPRQLPQPLMTKGAPAPPLASCRPTHVD